MDATKETFGQGFALGETFFWKAFRNKKLFLVAVIGAFFELLHQLVIVRFYNTCLWCLFVNTFLFGAIAYFFALVLFFYMRKTWHEKTSLGAVIPTLLRDCLKKSFSIVKTPLFWIFVFIPLPGMTSFLFLPFFIPVLAFQRETIGASFSFLGSLIKRFWKLVLGFSLYLFVLCILAGLIFFIPLSVCGNADLFTVCGIVMACSMLLFASLLAVLMAFVQVHIHEESCKP